MEQSPGTPGASGHIPGAERGEPSGSVTNSKLRQVGCTKIRSEMKARKDNQLFKIMHKTRQEGYMDLGQKAQQVWVAASIWQREGKETEPGNVLGLWLIAKRTRD